MLARLNNKDLVKKIILCSMLFGTTILCFGCKDKSQNDSTHKQFIEHVHENDVYGNLNLFEHTRSKIKFSLAFVENFYSKSYFCGKAWTEGNGLTILYDSSGATYKSVTDSNVCTVDENDMYVDRYLNFEVLPDIENYITVPIDENTLIATCVFRYCIGHEKFITSEYLKALNNGVAGENLAKYLTGFRQPIGLLKRHYFFAALLAKKITFQDITKLRAEGCYSLCLSDIVQMTTDKKSNDAEEVFKTYDDFAVWKFDNIKNNLATASKIRISRGGWCEYVQNIVPDHVLKDVIGKEKMVKDYAKVECMAFMMILMLTFATFFKYFYKKNKSR